MRLRDNLVFKYIGKNNLKEDTCLVLFMYCYIEMDSLLNIVQTTGNHMGMAVMKWTESSWKCLYYNLRQDSGVDQIILAMGESSLLMPVSGNGNSIRIPCGNDMLIYELMDDVPSMILRVAPPEDYMDSDDYKWTHDDIRVLPEMVSGHNDLEAVSSGLCLKDKTKYTVTRRYRYSPLEREYRLIEPDQTARLPASR